MEHIQLPVEETQSPLLIYDHKSLDIIKANPAARSLYGYRKDEMHSMNLKDLFYEEELTALDQTQNDGETQQMHSGVWTGKTKQGEERYVRIQTNVGQYKGKKCQFAFIFDVTDQVLSQQKLQKANKEKETLLSEIHHRVKNNLAVISSLIEMQAMEEEDTRLREKLDNAKLRIKSIAMIHELLYESDSFTEVNFSKNLEKMAEIVSQTLQAKAEISIEYDLEPVVLNVNDAMPLANIANELITNAYKHAFVGQEDGIITLKLSEHDEEITMEVIDNGRGLPNDFDPKSTSSLGFSIVNSLIDQLDADLTIDNNGGAQFKITLEKTETVHEITRNMDREQQVAELSK